MINIVSSFLVSFKLKCIPYQAYRLVILLLIIYLLPGRLSAQQAFPLQYDQQHFTDENGLPQNSVKSIIQDKDGFIWLTTEDGLVRYDGQRFFTFDNSVVPIRSNRMGSFYPANNVQDKYSNAFFALSDAADYLEIKDGIVLSNGSSFDKFLAAMPFSNEYREHKAVIWQSLPYSRF